MTLSLKALIEKMLSMFTVSIAAFTPASGVTHQTTYVRKVGRVVTVNIFITAGANPTSGEKLVCTLPSGYRPLETMRGALGHTGAVTGACYYVLDTQGALSVNFTGSGYILASITYIV